MSDSRIDQRSGGVFARGSVGPRLMAAACLWITFSGVTALSAADKKTNIVLVMVDDLGWMDLHCQGNKRLSTPHIDRLASQGMRFTDAYAAAPVCSPTRAAVLTGQSPARLHLTTHIPDREGFTPQDSRLLPAQTHDQLAAEHITVAERLKQAGYATGFFGKWHLAGRSQRMGLGLAECYPENQGFDLNLGGCAYGGPPTYFDPYRIHNLKSRRPGEYLTDRLVDESIDFIRAHQEDPFMLFLWNYTVHWPVEAKPEIIAKYKGREGPGIKNAGYAAMIEILDSAMGRLLAELDALKLSERTLVIFTSDNGAFLGVSDNSPLRSGKGYLYEGGIRVPLIVRWPGHVDPGSLCDTPVISMDFYPTILAAAGLTPQAGRPLDGENLMPLLSQTGSLKRSAIYFHYPNFAWHKDNRLGSVVRHGKYKLIEYFDDNSVELYDLEADLRETRDLSRELPDTARRLQRELHGWRQKSGARLPRKRDAAASR